MNKNLIRIAVMGPESTGKSQISAFLASHYGCPWVPEFAREYCQTLDHDPTMDDEIAILSGQLELENSIAENAEKMIICDTMFLTIKIWSQHVFGSYPEAVEKKLNTHPYDFFLVMNIDLPWEDDPLRNFPHLREHFLQIHLSEIKKLQKPYALITGLGKEREIAALKAVDGFLKTYGF